MLVDQAPRIKVLQVAQQARHSFKVAVAVQVR
jgi:hypothetical protein